jgi:hypothetical protein
MLGLLRNYRKRRQENAELDRIARRLAGFGEVLGSGLAVMLPMGVKIRQWAEERIEKRLSPATSSGLDTEEFFSFLDKIISALPDSELELLHAELEILSSPEVSGLWRDDFVANDRTQRDELTDGLSHFIVGCWVFCKIQVRGSRSESIQRRAGELEELCLWHMTQLVKVVKGESV